MFERNVAAQISTLWDESKSPNFTAAGRLERKIYAFLWAMRVIIDAVQSVQKLWSGASMAALMAGDSSAALDSGGTITKASIYKYQALLLAFVSFLDTPVVAVINGQTVTLSETPTQLIMGQPEKVTGE